MYQTAAGLAFHYPSRVLAGRAPPVPSISCRPSTVILNLPMDLDTTQVGEAVEWSYGCPLLTKLDKISRTRPSFGPDPPQDHPRATKGYGVSQWRVRARMASRLSTGRPPSWHEAEGL